MEDFLLDGRVQGESFFRQVFSVEAGASVGAWRWGVAASGQERTADTHRNLRQNRRDGDGDLRGYFGGAGARRRTYRPFNYPQVQLP